LYYFRHQRADLQISEGVIPHGFFSKIWLDEGEPIFLETRCGGWNLEDNTPLGPEFKVMYKKEQEVVPPVSASGGEGWSNNLDELWIAVLSYFERKNILSENTLEYLDADPFVLFGLDDKVTQQAILKLQKFSALHCYGTKPTIEEWALYLKIHPDDTQMRWLVEALAETELPKPWTCYKGVGSIVCYIRSDSGSVTWKHPFYDYFRQLRTFCEQGTPTEVMQVRVNRLLWQYEATRVETEHYQEPLINPEQCRKLAEIFGYDIAREGCIVRNLKAFLKVFAKTYRETQEIMINDVISCSEILKRDQDKHEEMKTEWGTNATTDAAFDLKDLSNGKILCVNCANKALTYCLECKDYLCLDCYDKLHQNGARRQHAPFRLSACSLCKSMPAKLHCNFTDKSLCHECYAMKHIKFLPPDGKENRPRQINYKEQYIRYATMAKDRQKKLAATTGNADDNIDDAYESVLSTDWHPFYDSRGVKYYHNFRTGERMRQSPRRVPNSADPGAPPDLKVIKESDEEKAAQEATALPGEIREARTKTQPEAKPLALNGFDAYDTGPRAAQTAVEGNRALRAPHRTYMQTDKKSLAAG
jgi:hypothetical protein